MHTRMCIHSQASGVPGPPPNGMERGRGRHSCQWTVGRCWGPPGLTRKPFANRKPYNVVRALVLIIFNLYFKPYTQLLNPAQMQALSPKQHINRQS